MDLDKFSEKYFDPNDNTGFSDVIMARQFKLKSLRERLKKYYLTDKEIDNLFEIIIKAEVEMENIKKKVDYNKCTQHDLNNLYRNLLSVQYKMKEDFDKKLNAFLKAKYEKAKKIVEKRKKH